MIFKIAKKAGQIEKTMQKEKTRKPKKENRTEVIANEDVSTDYSTGINTSSGHTISINRKTIRDIVLLNETVRILIVPYK